MTVRWWLTSAPPVPGNALSGAIRPIQAPIEPFLKERSAVFEYIEICHTRHRRHSALGYQSPSNYEAWGL